MSRARAIIFYQMEVYAGDWWKPASERVYACPAGLFGRMLTRLKLTPAQRLKRVGVASNFSATMQGYDDWKPNFFYNGRHDSLVVLR